MPKVFVVDDSIGACIAIERILSSADYDVVWERQAETGLMTVEKHAPDLVLCDLVMPDIDGYEFCHSVRENPMLRRVPVILMSGLVDDVVRARAREIGAAAVLPKPFKPEELVGLIEEVLGIEAAGTEAESESGRPEPRAPEGWEPMMTLLDTEFDTVRAFRFAGVIDSNGEVVTTRGRVSGPAATLGPDLIRLVRRATDLIQRLDQRSLHGVSLESEDAVLLLRALPAEHLLMVVLEDRGDIGKARYLIRKASGLV